MRKMSYNTNMKGRKGGKMPLEIRERIANRISLLKLCRWAPNYNSSIMKRDFLKNYWWGRIVNRCLFLIKFLLNSPSEV